MAENEKLTEANHALTRQSAGAIIDESGRFSEGPVQKGGVNTAPPCPRPDVTPGAQRKAVPAQNNGSQTER